MIGQYKGFIAENCAPPDVNTISIYDANDVKRASMAVPSFMRYPSGEKLYSFGIISDTHILAQNEGYSNAYPSLKLDNALAWFEEQGASFVCHAGDITNHGLGSSDGTQDLTQFAEYKRICDLHPNIPVYAICGNHDSYFSAITETLTELEEYTGRGLYYSVEHGNDLFIFVGQPESNSAMNDEEYEWLSSTIASSGGKRCFVFVHPFFSNDSGNPLDTYSGNMLDARPELKTLLSQYNTILLHGHSHFKFDNQEIEKSANYTEKNGFHSMHIPSLTAPAFINEEGTREQIPSEGYGFLVDVFADCVVFRGRDFGTISDEAITDPKWLPISTYKLNISQP